MNATLRQRKRATVSRETATGNSSNLLNSSFLQLPSYRVCLVLSVAGVLIALVMAIGSFSATSVVNTLPPQLKTAHALHHGPATEQDTNSAEEKAKNILFSAPAPALDNSQIHEYLSRCQTKSPPIDGKYAVEGTMGPLTYADCGRCWLHAQTGVIVSLKQVDWFNQSTIRIHLENVGKIEESVSHDDISIYVMVTGDHDNNGGMAVALDDSSTSLHWVYDYQVSASFGSKAYRIDANLVNFGGQLDHNPDACQATKQVRFSLNSNSSHLISGNDDGLILRSIPTEWRFYGKEEGCCEWCSRVEECESWLSGPKGVDRCILLPTNPFEGSDIMSVVDSRENQQARDWWGGTSKRQKKRWYLGSLLNIQPTVCADSGMDVILHSGIEITIDVAIETTDKALSNCEHVMPNSGRWLSTAGQCSQTAESQQACWIDDAVNQRFKLQDGVLYKRAKSRWQPHQCRHGVHWLPQQLQQCLLDKQLTPVGMAGDSIIRLFTLGASQTLFGDTKWARTQRKAEGHNYVFRWNHTSGVELWFIGYNDRYTTSEWLHQFVKNPESKPRLLIHNLQLTHEIWHSNATTIEYRLTQTRKQLNELFRTHYGENEVDWPLRVLFESPLFLSEREYHDTAARSYQFNQLAQKVFSDWHVLPVHAISQARMLDSTNHKDGVADGMHMAHNLQLELARVLFDFLCS